MVGMKCLNTVINVCTSVHFPATGYEGLNESLKIHRDAHDEIYELLVLAALLKQLGLSR